MDRAQLRIRKATLTAGDKRGRVFGLVPLMLFLVLVGRDLTSSASHSSQPKRLGQVDAARLAHADSEPGQWLTTGRDAGGSYFSPLSQINEQSVKKLGFAWQYALGTARGLEASPLVVDGVMFAAGNYGRVYALNAATGAELWTFVPTVDMQWARFACCDVVNRGIALREGRVYVAALDGYLYCLDANTGKPIWKTDTLIGREKHIPYTVTGSPVVTRDAVVIGNGGADYPGVRGYITAFDLDSGKFKWRFFTVPRNPALGEQDQPHLVQAVKTWDPRHQWEAGGGGNVWDGLSYDPQTDLVFMGTANVSPYNTRQDGRKGGDELYGCSVIAVHASNGEMAWYYQEVPDDRWDFDSTQKFILTTLTIGGAKHDVLLHAAKNGFFYVFDRATGEVLTGKNFTFVNWTQGLDPVTHKPIPNPAADYNEKPALVWPSAFGAHSWHPMSFNPGTGLVYIPALEAPNVMIEISKRPAKAVDGWFTVQGIMPGDYDPAQTVRLYGPLPSLESLEQTSPGPIKPEGVLKAWDPVSGKVAWQTAATTIWDGGVMSTGGNLVFRGDARGFLNVYAADSGKMVKSIDIGTGIMAAPVTYSVGGEQYVAFMAGYGGALGFSFAPDTAAYKYGNAGRIVALKLGGGSVPKPSEVTDPPFQKPPLDRGSRAQVLQGEILYNRVCSRCHVFGRGMMPDLRRMSAPTHGIFNAIVLQGVYRPKGMGRFDDVLSRADTEAIHAYLLDQAWDAYEGKAAPVMKTY
jgi:quinohemoprotein ethanol dehydrogenase